MDLLIKGIGMPKEGQVIVIDSTGQVWSNEWPARGYTRIDNAKAIPVPPHGPLIDADESIEVQMFDEMYEEWTLKTMSVADYLAFAADTPPTIIEAEEGEDG